MSRTINVDNAGKERTRVSKEVVLAMRELMQQKEENEQLLDLVAFLIESIEKMSKTIDLSVAAWEKRDYWIKAERFRMEWQWSTEVPEKLRKIMQTHDWGNLASIVAMVSQKLGKVIVAKKNQIGSPWIGAYDRFMQKKSRS